jgi:hypothetical protein
MELSSEWTYDPMAIGIFEPFIVGRGLRWHEALGESGIFHSAPETPRTVMTSTAKRPAYASVFARWQHALAGAAIKRRLDERIFFLESVDRVTICSLLSEL